MSTRHAAISHIEALFDTGSFTHRLDALVSEKTESQRHDNSNVLDHYLNDTLAPMLRALGFDNTIHENPVKQGGPIMVSQRIESSELPTVLLYGHGDVVIGDQAAWTAPLEPFRLHQTDERLYGRGTADNKGQHLVNIMALEQVIASRGSLGFNVTLLMEMSEETGSTGLREFCELQRDVLAADVFIASDAPRLRPGTPTLYLGSRGALPFELSVELREGGRHSGNFGGLLADPAIILANAIGSITDQHGKLLVERWAPASLTPRMREILAQLPPVEADIPLDTEWGEPGLSPTERVFGWNSFCVLAMISGSPEHPVNAIAGSARASCQLRYVKGTRVEELIPALKQHLHQHGFPQVKVTPGDKGKFNATRLDPDNEWVNLVSDSIQHTLGMAPDILPNIGGSVPNDCFADILGLPTLWLPHSYAGCRQHAPNEHNLKPLLRQALSMMTGIFWDIGEGRKLPI